MGYYCSFLILKDACDGQFLPCNIFNPNSMDAYILSMSKRARLDMHASVHGAQFKVD